MEESWLKDLFYKIYASKIVKKCLIFTHTQERAIRANTLIDVYHIQHTQFLDTQMFSIHSTKNLFYQHTACNVMTKPLLFKDLIRVSSIVNSEHSPLQNLFKRWMVKFPSVNLVYMLGVIFLGLLCLAGIVTEVQKHILLTVCRWRFHLPICSAWMNCFIGEVSWTYCIQSFDVSPLFRF